jgi:hypothetical protein
MSNEFLLRFQEFLGRNGWPTDASPWGVVERWEALIDECADCYQWGFYEFDNEVQVRGLLERALNDPKLTAYDQIAEIKQRVAAADDRFRKLLGPMRISTEETAWWHRAVLARADDEYRDDMRRLYNIEVDPC